jgi:hypothetical protein
MVRIQTSKKDLNSCIQVAGDCKRVRIPGGSLFSNCLPLHLREAAVDKQLCSCDEACVV